MLGEPAPVRLRVEDDDPGCDVRRDPAVVAGDPACESDARAHGRDQRLRIDDLGLELDHEQTSRSGVPRKDVDDPALPVDRERDLGAPRPAIESSEIGSEGLVECGVAGVDDAIHVSAAPPQADVEAQAERIRDRLEDVQRCTTHAVAFKATDGLTPDARSARHVDLAKALASSACAKACRDPSIVHARTMPARPSLSLARHFARAARDRRSVQTGGYDAGRCPNRS